MGRPARCVVGSAALVLRRGKRSARPAYVSALPSDTVVTMTSACRFCIGDHYYLCDNKILCQFDYEERLVLARLSSSYNSLAQMKKLQQPAPPSATATSQATTASTTGSAASAQTSAD